MSYRRAVSKRTADSNPSWVPAPRLQTVHYHLEKLSRRDRLLDILPARSEGERRGAWRTMAVLFERRPGLVRRDVMLCTRQGHLKCACKSARSCFSHFQPRQSDSGPSLWLSNYQCTHKRKRLTKNIIISCVYRSLQGTLVTLLSLCLLTMPSFFWELLCFGSNINTRI